MQKPDFKTLLQGAGFKATLGRIALLEALWHTQKPLAVPALTKSVGRKMNQVTLYRALEALASAGISRRVDLGHAHAHYEFEKSHHHHIICTDCGRVEDITNVNVEKELEKLSHSSKQFNSIYSHNLEFFGSCKSCTK